MKEEKNQTGGFIWEKWSQVMLKDKKEKKEKPAKRYSPIARWFLTT